eukprot:3815832-Pyramimonas_sp.AAC.1
MGRQRFWANWRRSSAPPSGAARRRTAHHKKHGQATKGSHVPELANSGLRSLPRKSRRVNKRPGSVLM